MKGQPNDPRIYRGALPGRDPAGRSISFLWLWRVKEMARFEITGGNGCGATLSEIQKALRKAGAKNVRKRRAFGMSNQPYVATFAASCELEAKKVCKAACGHLWPRDESIMANLIAFQYST